MIAYLKGKLTFKSPTFVLVECNGVGYQVFISLQTFSKIEQIEDTLLHTVQVIKEDSHSLFGFFDQEEKEYFQYLLTVSGVGANTARIILSTMTTTEVKSAILMDQPEAFKRVKGVGPKTAKQIILDLKDKLMKAGDGGVEFVPVKGNIAIDEALSALIALGFVRQKASQVLLKIQKEQSEIQTVEQMIKAALNQMS